LEGDLEVGTDIVRVEDWSSSLYDATWFLPYHFTENEECGGYFREFYVISSRISFNIYCRS
jgi:hypothetical protein